MGFVLRVVFAVAALVLASRDLRSGTLDWRGNWRTDVLWLLGGFAGVLAVAVLGSIPAALTDAPVADNIARREAQVAALGAPLVAVSSWVLAPLTEETVFRLAMIGRASARLPLWLCVTISSVVFGMVHSSQWDAAHLLSILPHILIGAVLGVVYAKSRNITIPILIHAMTNVLG
jgi:membrane protease YdiL (CAAX protease family)